MRVGSNRAKGLIGYFLTSTEYIKTMWNQVVQNRTLDKTWKLRQSFVMESGGGTQVWCANCGAIRECKVLWYDNYAKGNFVDEDFSDLHYRQRPRECNTCGKIFNTREVNSSVIDELVALRKLFLGFQVNIEDQQKSITEMIKKYKPVKNKA